MKIRSAALSLLAVACAHHQPPPPLVPPAVVPRAAVDMLCSRMRAEGMTAELRAVRMTQPLITPQAIEGMASAMFYRGRSLPQVSAVMTEPVETAGSCVVRSIDSITARESDVMVVEFSSPFENPFARRQLGVLARVSLGNEAASWYWIPIGERNGLWGAADPIMLDIRE